MNDATRTELEAAAFRRLVEHLRARTDVQNIDLMNLAGFCRNCLSRWYSEAAGERGLDVGYEDARTLLYGMPYAEWKAKYQTEATPEQTAKLATTHPGH
ncbi:MAG: DUF1244 domain-containing protein [Rhodospirillaceae bacterium]|nr:DUF1244 domain-containing protein [Rhodospirillaceae bacterium]